MSSVNGAWFLSHIAIVIPDGSRSEPIRDPYVDGPRLARGEAACGSDRLRSYVRSVDAVTHDRCQDGFRDASSKHVRGVEPPLGPAECLASGIDRSRHLLRLEQAPASSWRRGLPPC